MTVKPQFEEPASGAKRAAREVPLILIVDDDLITREVLQEVLLSAGYRTLCASDVAGAYDELRTQSPDLILLDVYLPDGIGFDVCRNLKKSPDTSQIPVLFISANEDIATKVLGFESGGVDYIPKPLAGPEIIARVTTHLRLKRSFEIMAELQAERVQRLALTQKAVMPSPGDIPEAHFDVSLNQVLQAGGDFYDVIPISSHITDYVVADASGHDLSASFWTASLKTLLSEYASPLNSPRDMLYALNRTLKKILPEGVFFTVIYGRLNRKTGKLIVANAGHPPVCIVSQQERYSGPLHQEGDVIGAFDDAEFGADEIPVLRGDRFYLYSDGLIELNGSHEQGVRILNASCRDNHCLSLGEAVRHIVESITLDKVLQDDTVLLGVEV